MAHIADKMQGDPLPTPSNHRTQLGPTAQTFSHLSSGGLHNANSAANRTSQSQTPAHREPFASLNTNTLNRPGASGFGMSAGMKIGKQSGTSSFL